MGLLNKNIFIVKILFLSSLYFLTFADTSYAYIGPGAGLSLIGFLVAIIIALIVMLVGLILYPYKLLKKYLEKKKQSKEKRNS